MPAGTAYLGLSLVDVEFSSLAIIDYHWLLLMPLQEQSEDCHELERGAV